MSPDNGFIRSRCTGYDIGLFFCGSAATKGGQEDLFVAVQKGFEIENHFFLSFFGSRLRPAEGGFRSLVFTISLPTEVCIFGLKNWLFS